MTALKPNLKSTVKKEANRKPTLTECNAKRLSFEKTKETTEFMVSLRGKRYLRDVTPQQHRVSNQEVKGGEMDEGRTENGRPPVWHSERQAGDQKKKFKGGKKKTSGPGWDQQQESRQMTNTLN